MPWPRHRARKRALDTLIAKLTSVETALTGQGSVATLALQALQKSGSDAAVAGAFATLDAQADSSLSRIGGALGALHAVELITPANAIAGLTALQRDLDLQAQAHDLFETLESYAARAAAVQGQVRTAVAQIALSRPTRWEPSRLSAPPWPKHAPS